MKDNKNRLLHTARFLNYLISRNGVIEVRLFCDNKTYYGYFDCYKTCLQAISEVHRKKPGVPYNDYPRDGEASAIYYTLNAIPPQYLAKSNNRIQFAKSGSTTSDTDISRITHILIDSDPVRNPVSISSTKKEKHLSAGVIRRVRRYLSKMGIRSILGDSGNGFHLLIPVDYPSEDSTKVALLLHHLHNKFSTPYAHVDTTVYNPARISKLYGTWVKKGDEITDRPHRISNITLPKGFTIEPQDVLGITKDIVDYTAKIDLKKKPQQGAKTPSLNTNTPNDNKHSEHVDLLRSVLDSFGAPYREKDKGGRTVFEFETCPVHTDYDTHTYECAVMVESNGILSGKCQHDESKTWFDFKEAIGFEENRPPRPQHTPASVSIGPSQAPVTVTVTGIEQVIPIGYSSTSYMFYCYDSSQYITCSLESINIPHLCSDWGYWAQKYPHAFKVAKNGDLVRDKHTAVALRECLMEDCKKTGNKIQYMEVRETGVYTDNNSIVACLGNKIFIDGVMSSYYDAAHDLNNRYQSGPPVPVSLSPSTSSEYKKAIDIIKKTTISQNAESWLVLGIICCGYLSGIAKWRAHAWITGLKASGKSEFKSLIIEKLIKAIGGVSIVGTVSEAGIRQYLGNKRTILVHDEAEHNRFIVSELELARVSSSGGTITKGSPTGKPVVYHAYSTFVMLSISDSILLDQDSERFISITLKPRKDSETEWSDIRAEIESSFTEELGARFCLRMVNSANVFNKLCQVCEVQFVDYFKKKYANLPKNIQRLAQLYSGPIAASLLMLRTYESVQPENIEVFLESLDKSGKVTEYTDSGDNEDEDSQGNMAISVYNKFLDTQVKLTVDEHSVTYTIREFLDTETLDTHKKSLRQYGIYYMPTQGRIKFKLKNKYLIDIFTQIGYPNYRQILRGVPGFSIGLSRKFGVEVLKGLELPYPLKINDENALPEDCEGGIFIKPEMLPFIPGHDD